MEHLLGRQLVGIESSDGDNGQLVMVMTVMMMVVCSGGSDYNGNDGGVDEDGDDQYSDGGGEEEDGDYFMKTVTRSDEWQYYQQRLITPAQNLIG